MVAKLESLFLIETEVERRRCVLRVTAQVAMTQHQLLHLFPWRHNGIGQPVEFPQEQRRLVNMGRRASDEVKEHVNDRVVSVLRRDDAVPLAPRFRAAPRIQRYRKPEGH